MASQSRTHIRRHLNGEHNRWCQQLKGEVMLYRWTGAIIRSVKLRQTREVGDAN
jgi:hypothetical protein